MAHSVSPLAPRAVPHLPVIDGVELAIAETGIPPARLVAVIRAWDMTPGSATRGEVLTIR